jgi:2-polyprenyl-3-methyl-5-hydroxy-6-metoxy-1,4-benzoquinol methylase
VTFSDYGKYLAAKKSVDDRALNADVLRCLGARMRAHAAPELRILEIGAGLGTMPARLMDLGLLQRAHYTLLDTDAQLLEESKTWLSTWATRNGHLAQEHEGELQIDGVRLRCEHCDVMEFLRRPEARGQYDLLVANAVLDLVDVPVVLPQLLALLRRDGLYWFSINFDGDTIFSPEHEADRSLMHVYHRSMDERRRDGQIAGDSHTGRHLFEHLTKADATILSAGSSDWVVFGQGGEYPHAEGEFLRFIVRTIDEQLQQHDDVDREKLAQWIALRYAQIDRGELVYIAHQLDFVGTLVP